MKVTKNFQWAIVATTAATLVGCGAKDSADTTAAEAIVISDISQLPSAVAPVVSNSAAAIMKRLEREQANRQAVTGLNLYTASSASFNTNTSRGMCEITNYTKELVDGAAQTEKTMCYVRETVTETTNAAALTAAGVNLLDGQYHIFALDFGQGEANNPKVKLKVVKTGDSITGFEMFGCFHGNGQSEYQSKTIGTDGSVTMLSKNSGSEGAQTWTNNLTLTGTINKDRAFTAKSVVSKTTMENATWSGTSKITLSQFADRLDFSGFQTGTGLGAQAGGSHTAKIFAQYEFIDGNTASSDYSLRNLAMGHGNYKAELVDVWNSQTFNQTVEGAWDSDTKLELAAASGPYYAGVTAGTVPDVETVTFAFEAAEAWDCSGTAEATLAVDQAALNTACSALALRQDGEESYINCHQIDQQ